MTAYNWSRVNVCRTCKLPFRTPSPNARHCPACRCSEAVRAEQVERHRASSARFYAKQRTIKGWAR